MSRFSFRLSFACALFVAICGSPVVAAEGNDVPPLVEPGGKAIGDDAVGAGDATQNGKAAIPLALNTSSQVWTTFKGDWQRSGASKARLDFPLGLLWRHSTDAAPGIIASSPLVTGPAGARRVFFATGKTIYCIDGQDGTRRWSTELNGVVRAPVSLLSGDGGDTLLAVTTTGQIAAIKASDGMVRWSIETRTPFQGVAPVVAQTANGQRILLADVDGNIIAYDNSGRPDKTFRVKLALGNARTVPSSTPLVSREGDRLFVVARDKKLYSINTKDAKMEYQVPLRGTSLTTPALIDDTIVVGMDNRLAGLFADAGQAKWQAILTDRNGAPDRILSSPAGGDGRVYVGTVKKSLYAIDLQTGEVDWKVDLKSPVSGTPLVLPTAILVGTRNGMMFALKPEDGTILWRYRLHTERLVRVVPAVNPNQFPGAQPFNPIDPNNPNQPPAAPQGMLELRTMSVSSAPTVVDGMLFVVADNAALYCLSEGTPDAEAPRVLKAAFISGRTVQGYTGQRPIIVTGKSAISLQVTLDDLGSGVDPDKFQVTLDNQDIVPDNLEWNAANGRLTIAISKPDKNGKTAVMADGAYKIEVTVRDYKGNVLTYPAVLNVYKDLMAPPIPTVEPPVDTLGDTPEDMAPGAPDEMPMNR